MAVSLGAARNLTLICACLVAIAALALVEGGARAIAGVFDIGIAGVRPFHGIAVAIRNSIVSWTGREITSLQRHVIALFSGLIDSLAIILGVFLILGLGVKAALQYLWNHALVPRIESRVKTIRDDATEALTKAKAATSRVENLATGLSDRIGTAVQAALNTARAYTRDQIADLRHGIGEDIGAIRSSIDQAIEHANRVAAQESGRAIGELRAAEEAAIGTIERNIDRGFTEIRDQLRNLNPAEIAGLIAAVPALALLVDTLAAESGLDRAECRSKVKGICGTDAGAFDWLLGGAFVLAGGLSLAAIVEAGREIIGYVESGASDLADLG